MEEKQLRKTPWEVFLVRFTPEIQPLIALALEVESWEPLSGEACWLIIKSISPKQRPRVPTGAIKA